MIFKKTSGVFLLVIFSILVSAQSWEHFSTVNNLSSNFITSIAVDHYNHKWIATGGGGLVEFDEKNWTTYNTSTTNEGLKTNFLTCVAVQENIKWIGTKTGVFSFDGDQWTEYSSMNTNNSLPVSQVNSIVVDKDKSVWVATNNGLSKFNGQNWTYYTKYALSELAGNKVSSIAIDGKGHKWVGTSTGLSFFDGTNWKNISKGNPAFKDQNIQNVLIDKTNNVWVATAGAGLMRYNGSEWKSYTSASVNIEGFKDNFKAMLCDDENTIWLACQKGFIKFSEEKCELVKPETVFQEEPLCLSKDLKGKIWTGTEKSGLWYYNGKEWGGYNTHNNIPNDFISDIVIDHENNKWIGTNGGGIVKLVKGEWVLYNQSNGLNDNYIKALMLEGKTNVYAGSQWGGLMRFDGHSWHHYNTSNSKIASDHISSMTIDNNELLWLGTEGYGLAVFDGTLWFDHTAAKTTGMIPDDHITCLQFEKKTETLWVGTQSGLSTYKNSSWKNNEQFAQKNITAMEIDISGNKWIGTTEGIYRLNDQLTFFGPENISDHLDEVHVNTIYSDKKGVVWVGTGRGLLKYENNSWKVFNPHTTFGGLSSENIYSVISDEKGFLWVGTSNGLFKADFSVASSGSEDSDRDGIIDSLDLCPAQMGVFENRGCPALEGNEQATLQNVFSHLLFETNKDIILHTSHKSLNQLAELLVNDTQLQLYVEGHTDNLGEENKNKELSQRRADAVKNYLTSKGVDAGRISTKGFGSSRPKTRNDTEEGRKVNRRVEMYLFHGK